MGTPVIVGVIGATGKRGRSVVYGLLTSPTKFQTITSFIQALVDSQVNKTLKAKGVKNVGYDLNGPRGVLVDQLKGIDVLISCITWEHLESQVPWIEAAKEAGAKRLVPSDWVGPAPRGIIDIKDEKFIILVLFNGWAFRTLSSTLDVGAGLGTRNSIRSVGPRLFGLH
ncbi:hypothetical protein BDQ94DRAFT_168266 [Aspergillus welwitschiae]|uniref:NmrA-like domain-containing protein n=1 Tax=Aspergillus welwitschiae TaxID=1341132 RepID=A0A3F3Q9V7_9EURO|nr:hypothetical protein BDQ94DRAFT_168266 [Aspergillus welwitschiae]RDH35949.1 hypothetical protein BDQ94DRAFT_168266 [Aspergillus welwitschiae]